MELQTKIPLSKQLHSPIDYKSKILLLGSCFTESIGSKLDYFMFQNIINPFGILFHPKAIERLIANAINEKEYTAVDVFYQNEQWHCFDAHSKLSNFSKETLLVDLNDAIKSTKQRINNSSHIIITLGTSWTYRHIESDAIVANCHKVPQKQFLKELLCVDEIANSLQAIVALIKQENPLASIIFTVSPVRHIKDGFVENTLSKANLISGIHKVIEERDKIFYFPSYEIMMDELRDYRFYAEDMIHPDSTAINYIWEAFNKVWLSIDALEVMLNVDVVQKGLNHRPFNSNSDLHKSFLKNLKKKQEQLSAQYPHIIFKRLN